MITALLGTSGLLLRTLATAPSARFGTRMGNALHLAALGVTAIAAVGCNRQGQARNPAFTSAVAAQPTVMVSPLACRSGDGSGSTALDLEFARQIQASMKARTVDLTPEQRQSLCSIVLAEKARQRSTYSERLLAGSKPEWSEGSGVAAVVQDVGRRTGAKSVFLAVSLGYTMCRTADYQVDRDGRPLLSDRARQTAVGPVERVHKERCDQGHGAMMRGFLFSADGTVLWKSWSTGRVDSPPAMQKAISTLLAGLPATVTHGADQAPSAAAAPGVSAAR